MNQHSNNPVASDSSFFWSIVEPGRALSIKELTRFAWLKRYDALYPSGRLAQLQHKPHGLPAIPETAIEGKKKSRKLNFSAKRKIELRLFDALIPTVVLCGYIFQNFNLGWTGQSAVGAHSVFQCFCWAGS